VDFRAEMDAARENYTKIFTSLNAGIPELLNILPRGLSLASDVITTAQYEHGQSVEKEFVFKKHFFGIDTHQFDRSTSTYTASPKTLKIKILTKNWNVGKNRNIGKKSIEIFTQIKTQSKFWPQIKIIAKNQGFSQKSHFLAKNQGFSQKSNFLAKNQGFSQKPKFKIMAKNQSFSQKSKLWPTIKIMAKNRSFSHKSQFWPKCRPGVSDKIRCFENNETMSLIFEKT